MSFDFKSEKEKGKAAGRAFVEGLGVGLDEGSYAAITELENVYTVLETLTKNAAKNAENLQKKRQERQLSNLKTARELELICEQEYYEKLKEFRDKNLKYGTDSWYKCTEEIAAYNKRLMENLENDQKKMLEKQAKLADDLKGKNKWLDTSTVRFKGMGVGGSDLVYSSARLDDFRDEIGLLEAYTKRLKELKELGTVPIGVFEDIAGMSVADGLAAINAILGADAPSRAAFLSGYETRNQKSKTAAGLLAEILYGGAYTFGNPDVQVVDSAQVSLEEHLEKSFSDVPPKYRELGKESGLAFGDGFAQSLPEIMDEIRGAFSSAVRSIALGTGLAGQGASGGVSTVNTFNNSYTFSAAKDTITQQLAAVKNAATLQRLRGGALE